MIASPDQIARVIHAELKRQADTQHPTIAPYVEAMDPGGDCVIDGRVNLVELAIAVMAQARTGYAAVVDVPSPAGREIRADRELAPVIHGTRQRLFVSSAPRFEINEEDLTADVQFEWRDGDDGPFNPYVDERVELLQNRNLAGERVTLQEIGCAADPDWSYVVQEVSIGSGGDGTTFFAARLAIGRLAVGRYAKR